MKRLGFIAALFGLKAAAQSAGGTPVCNPLPGQSRNRYVPTCPTTNGQCPLCGTTAPPWSRPTGVGAPYTSVPCGPNSTEVCMQATIIPFGATEKVVRCKTCNTAFWQDAQE